jgi:acyl-CoA thioester hydrolase
MSDATSDQGAPRWVHTARQSIRWGDMDAFGHVNNTVYFRYMETARVALLEHVGIQFGVDEGQGPVIVTAYCTFSKQLTYPGEIEVRTFVGQPGRSSIEVTHEIRLVGPDGDAPEVHAQGGAKVVWVDYAAGKSVPLPSQLRDLLPAA